MGSAKTSLAAEPAAAKSAGTGPQVASAPPPGANPSKPLYVVSQCEHGCEYSEDGKTFREKLSTDPVAAFTAVLAVFTAVLAVSTIALWWVTRGMADTSKKALLDLERPIVYGNVSEPGLELDGRGLTRSTIVLSVYNHGRTMARLRRIEWDLRLAASGSIAKATDPSKVGGRELPPGTVCVSGDPYFESENLFPKWGLETVEKIAAGELSVWVVGFVRYDDVFERRHISGFTLVFDRLGGRFVRRGSQAYNYERPERIEQIPPPSSTG